MLLVNVLDLPCHIAKTSSNRPLKCIETTEKWCRGEATLEEVKQAENAAWEARYAAYAASAAASAGSASASASAASASAASASAASAASASAASAYHAAPKNKEAAYQKMQLKTADLVRSLITRPDKMVEEYEHILKLKAFL